MYEFPRYTFDNQQERIGVHKVGLKLAELGLIFRETPNSDVGIDGHVEYVNNAGNATGKIVAVQIKSGDSYLYESVSDTEYWTFYPDEKHKSYWSSYPVPVILLAYSPSRDNVYFIDVRHYLKANGLGSIKIPKGNIFDVSTKSAIFETVGDFDEPFKKIKDVFHTMVLKRYNSPSFNLSYLDLFLIGITNMGRQIYFDMSIAMDIAECRNPYVDVGSAEYNFLYEYVRFLVNQNLAEIDFGECLIEWNERKLVPRFLAPLTHRGMALSKYVIEVEKEHSTVMPEIHLVQERLLQLAFDDYTNLRIEKAQEIQNQYRTLQE
jgi:hypothetical protein